MKVRIKGNSIRIRLDQKETRELLTNGIVEEQTFLGTAREEFIRYLVQRSTGLQIKASFRSNEIRVEVPEALIDQWVNGNEVSLEGIQEVEKGVYLKILIEKDLKPLLDREEEEDWFPNPKA